MNGCKQVFWQRVHETVLRRLREHAQIMWGPARVDAVSVPASAGSEHTGRNSTNRGKLGCKRHLLVDQRGLPLVAGISGTSGLALPAGHLGTNSALRRRVTRKARTMALGR